MQNTFLSMISFANDKFVLDEGRYKVTKNMFRTHVYPSLGLWFKNVSESVVSFVVCL